MTIKLTTKDNEKLFKVVERYCKKEVTWGVVLQSIEKILNHRVWYIQKNILEKEENKTSKIKREEI